MIHFDLQLIRCYMIVDLEFKLLYISLLYSAIFLEQFSSRLN